MKIDEPSYALGLAHGQRAAIEGLQQVVNILSEEQMKLVHAGAMKMPKVVIEIRGGVLVDVSGLLPGQQYELIDHDDADSL